MNLIITFCLSASKYLTLCGVYDPDMIPLDCCQAAAYCGEHSTIVSFCDDIPPKAMPCSYQQRKWLRETASWDGKGGGGGRQKLNTMGGGGREKSSIRFMYCLVCIFILFALGIILFGIHIVYFSFFRARRVKHGFVMRSPSFSVPGGSSTAMSCAIFFSVPGGSSTAFSCAILLFPCQEG